jgi:hypothetical protein
MRIRPWAPAGEVLDVFHDVLRRRRGDDGFWGELGRLVGILLEDRRVSSRGPDAAFADGGRREALLGEIRSALAARRRGAGRFRRLARRLSAPALGLLLVLGGAATAGCYGSHGEEDEDGSGTDVVDVRPEDAAPEDAGAEDAVPEDARPDDAADDAGCDASGAVFEEILARCMPGDEEWIVRRRAEVLACIAALHESWRAGLTEHYACAPCWEFENDISTCLIEGYLPTCEHPEDAGEFDLDRFLDNCAVLIYVGVRFE